MMDSYDDEMNDIACEHCGKPGSCDDNRIFYATALDVGTVSIMIV